MSDARLCCVIGCGKPATVTIEGSSGHPEDYTDACDVHIGELLGTPDWLPTLNTFWKVYPLADGAHQ